MYQDWQPKRPSRETAKTQTTWCFTKIPLRDFPVRQRERFPCPHQFSVPPVEDIVLSGLTLTSSDTILSSSTDYRNVHTCIGEEKHNLIGYAGNNAHRSAVRGRHDEELALIVSTNLSL